MNINYDSVPVDYMAGAVQRYVERGFEPGSFMQAILCNDLISAVGRADAFNRMYILEWVEWIDLNLPGNCWGSVERYDAWVRSGGQAGINGNR